MSTRTKINRQRFYPILIQHFYILFYAIMYNTKTIFIPTNAIKCDARLKIIQRLTSFNSAL